MHCKSCEQLVDMALEDLEGIDKVSSSHESGIVNVRFDESKVDTQTIKKTIQEDRKKESGDPGRCESDWWGDGK